MPRHEAFQGSLPLLVLKILSRRGPLHGYGITLRIHEATEEVLRVEEGSLYPALHRMEEAGHMDDHGQQAARPRLRNHEPGTGTVGRS